MGNFMGLVFATLKNEGIDTKGMSNDEAVKKFDELKGKNGGTPAEERELKKRGITSINKNSNNKELSKKQAEFFNESKAVDNDGNLQVVWHGTDKQFDVFTSTNSQEGNDAIWFSRSKEYAEEMAYLRDGNRVESFYLNMKNPLIVEMSAKDFADNAKEKQYIENAKKQGKDGVIFIEKSNYGEPDIFYAVFSSNQIKSTTNENPTENHNIYK
jgi:hypothetical protein